VKTISISDVGSSKNGRKIFQSTVSVKPYNADRELEKAVNLCHCKDDIEHGRLVTPPVAFITDMMLQSGSDLNTLELDSVAKKKSVSG
jgi:hypothetical protein